MVRARVRRLSVGLENKAHAAFPFGGSGVIGKLNRALVLTDKKTKQTQNRLHTNHKTINHRGKFST